MKTIKILTAMILIGGMFAFMGCEDEEPGKLQIESIVAEGTDLETEETVTKDLNAAQSPTDVPLDATVLITFSKNVDIKTISSTSVKITSSEGEVGVDISVDGAEVTLTPQSNLERGTQYSLELAQTIRAEDGGSFEAISRSFQTTDQAFATPPQVTPPQSDSQVAYFPFNNSTEDVAGGHTVTDNTKVTGYVTDRHGYMQSALQMDGEDDIVEVENPGDMINPSTTISFWFKTDLDDSHLENSMFFMGATAEFGYFIEMGFADGNPWLKTTTRHMQHPESANDFGSATAWGDAVRGNGTAPDVWEGDLAGMLDDQWVHYVLTYDQSTSMKRVYLNGTLVWENDLAAGDEWKMKEMHIDTASASNESMDIGIGFAGSTTNHSTGWADYETFINEATYKTFFGSIDDVRFFSTALTNTEVQTLYDAEKPQQ